MNLDDGICTIYHKVNTKGPAEKPAFVDEAYWRSWYGELNFETEPARPTENREEIRTATRVRILQNCRIGKHDRVRLEPRGAETLTYEVGRAYHGVDEESGELITDLSLEVVRP